MRTRRGREQGWILDRFLASGGLETLFREALPYFLEMGYQYIDLVSASEGAKSSGLLIKGLEAVGEERLNAGYEARDSGHLLTASSEFHRAAKCFSRAQWAIFEDCDRKRRIHARCTEAYRQLTGVSPYPIRQVEIDAGGGRVFANLHLPAHAGGPVPCVIFCPGLDMIKEDYPNVDRNGLVDRGMAVLSFDGPGHGETRLNGGLTWTIDEAGDNYGEIASPLVDHASSLPEIDAERIGIFGISQGSYWAPLMSARDERIRACACMMGSFYEQGFDSGQPTFKENLAYMMGIDDEGHLDEVIPRITLDGMEREIRGALLVLHGEMDELTPEEDARLFMDRAVNAAPKELVVYENEFHPLGGVSPQAFNRAADWLSVQLEAGISTRDGHEAV